VIDGDRALIHERVHQGISSLDDKIAILTFNSTKTFDEIRQSLSKMIASQHRIDRIFSTNISEVSDDNAGSKQIFSSRLNLLESRLISAKEKLQNSMKAAELHRTLELGVLMHQMRYAISSTQLQAHQELSDLSRMATENQTALSSYLLKNLALIRNHIDNRSSAFTMKMVSSEKVQSAINAIQLQTLKSLQQNVQKASGALEIRLNVLEQGFLKSNEEMTRSHINFMGQLDSLHTKMTSAFSTEYKMLENNSQELSTVEQSEQYGTIASGIRFAAEGRCDQTSGDPRTHSRNNLSEGRTNIFPVGAE
jgi:hypothetical protein